jgi:hypothetical protein
MLWTRLTRSPKNVHVDLLQKTHEEGVDLRYKSKQENDGEAQGEHWGGKKEKCVSESVGHNTSAKAHS